MFYFKFVSRIYLFRRNFQICFNMKAFHFCITRAVPNEHNCFPVSLLHGPAVSTLQMTLTVLFMFHQGGLTLCWHRLALVCAVLRYTRPQTARYLHRHTAAKHLMQCSYKGHLTWLNAFILRFYWRPRMEKYLEHKTPPNTSYFKCVT